MAPRRGTYPTIQHRSLTRLRVGETVDEMGVEFRIFHFPVDCTFRPSARRLADFVAALRSERWAASPREPWFRELSFADMKPHVFAAESGAYVHRLVEHQASYGPLPIDRDDVGAMFANVETQDLRVRWPVERMGTTPLRYPLNREAPVGREEAYYDLELWLSDDYVPITSEVIEPLESEECSCGAALSHELEGNPGSLFYASRLRRVCARCGEPFVPSTRSVLIRDPETGAGHHEPAVAFRFALVVDCGKCWPDPPQFDVHEDCAHHASHRSASRSAPCSTSTDSLFG